MTRTYLIMKTRMKRLVRVLTSLTLLLVPQLASAYYDPGLQRWINRDPLQESGFARRRGSAPVSEPEALCLYRYADNDPVHNIDAFGLRIGDYGNWCGYTRSGQNGGPIDQVDLACMLHDYCLATLADACTNFKPCNRLFCDMVAGADCSKSPDPKSCRSERRKILALCVLVSPILTY
jgi:RHS repeat-associated protein